MNPRLEIFGISLKMTKVKPGDLVYVFDILKHLRGLVISVEPMKDIYRDSDGKDQVYSCKILLEEDPPSWIGDGGRIVIVSDSIVGVINES